MVREYPDATCRPDGSAGTRSLAYPWGLVVALLPGCSLVLNFSDSEIPKDAQIDAPFNQAECDFGEPNNSAAAATPFLSSEIGPAGICTGDDHDFYRFAVPPNTASITISISFISSTTGDLDLRLTDKTGTTIHANSVGFGNVEKIVCPGASPFCALGSTPPIPADDYVFEVFPAVPGAVNRYDIALTITPM